MITINSNHFTWKKSKNDNHFTATICNGDMPKFEGSCFNVKSVKTKKILTFALDEEELVNNEWFDGELLPFHSNDGARTFTISVINDF